MTYSHPLSSWQLDHVDRLVRPVAVVTTVGTLGLHALAVWGDGSSTARHDPSRFMTASALTVGVAVVVFGFLVPAVLHRRASGLVALALGLVGLASAWAFTLGAAPVLGVAAVLVGLEHRHAGTQAEPAKAGVMLGTLATLAFVLMYVGDWMQSNGMI